MLPKKPKPKRGTTPFQEGEKVRLNLIGSGERQEESAAKADADKLTEIKKAIAALDAKRYQSTMPNPKLEAELRRLVSERRRILGLKKD